MAEARIVLIAVPVETSPVTTHFQVRFNTDGGETWTGYDPASASPSVPADVSVSTLDASSNYSLDGINSPTGNKAAASYEGNWYTLRLKSASGYGSWSEDFKIATEPDADGPFADLADLITDFALIADGELGTGSLSGWAYENNQARDRALSRLLTDAMDELRASSTVDLFYTGAPTTGQQRTLARVERYWAVADALSRPATMKALGIHEPLLMEESNQIMALAEQFRAKGDALLDRLLTPGITSTAFAMPSISSSTYTDDSGMTPSDRISLLDERDDLFALAVLDA